MNIFKDTIEYLTKFFQWWIIVMPWEKAVRVRFGKNIKILSEGTHFRIPFFDAIYLQSTRMRVVQMPIQTISTKDNQTLTLTVCAGYSISNIETLYQKMAMPESTITNMVMGEISDYIFSRNLLDCKPEDLEKIVMARLNLDDYGISYDYVKVVGYAVVRTYRLIQDQHWTPNNLDVSMKVQ